MHLHTLASVARNLGLTYGRVRYLVLRHRIDPTTHLDGSTPVYDAAAIERIRKVAAIPTRPGRPSATATPSR